MTVTVPEAIWLKSPIPNQEISLFNSLRIPLPVHDKGSANDVIDFPSGLPGIFVIHDVTNNELVIHPTNPGEAGTYTIDWRASPSPVVVNSFILTIHPNIHQPFFTSPPPNKIHVTMSTFKFVPLPSI